MLDSKTIDEAKGAILTDENVESPFFVSLNSEKETKKVVTLTEDQLRTHLSNLVAKGKRDVLNIAEFANSLGVSPQYLGAFLSGKRGPGKTILKALGVEVETAKLYHLPVYMEDSDD